MESVVFPKKLEGEKPTIKDAIDRFPRLESGQSSDIPNHEAMVHSQQMLEKMSYVKDGGDRELNPLLSPAINLTNSAFYCDMSFTQ